MTTKNAPESTTESTIAPDAESVAALLPPLVEDDDTVYLYTARSFRIKRQTGKAGATNPLAFHPRGSVVRFTTTATIARAWLAESDPVLARAMLADYVGKSTKSKVTPSGDNLRRMAALYADDAALAALARAGRLAVPGKVRDDADDDDGDDDTDDLDALSAIFG